MAITTTFSISDAASLAADIVSIGTSIVGSGGSYGANAAINTHYTFVLASDVTLNQASGPIWLSQGDTLTIVGNGHTLDGNGQYRGLFIYDQNPDTHVEINDLTIVNAAAQGGMSSKGGAGAGLGGGLFVNAGAVTLSNVYFRTDAARGGSTLDSGAFGGGGLGGPTSGQSSGGGGYSAPSPGQSNNGGDGFGFAQQGGTANSTGPGIGGGGGLGQNGNDFGGAGEGGTGGFGGGGGFFGNGGFGGGGGGGMGGAPAGSGGFGGQSGTTGYGGGGLGAGGAVFVRAGASLTIAGGTIAGNTVTGGTPGGPGAIDSSRALGSGIFLNGTTGLTLAPGLGQTLLVADTIADQSGNGGAGPNAGIGSVTIGGSGVVTLSGSNSYVGATTIGPGAQLLLTNANAAGLGPIVFAGGPGTLRLGANVTLANTISIGNSAVIDFAGLTSAPSVFNSASATTITGGGNQIVLSGSVSFTRSSDGGGGSNLNLTVACFLTGTRIRTTEGETLVEHVAVGTLLPTRSGTRPIVWIGHRAIDVTRHPFPTRVWPIRIRAGAFGEGQLSRDLYLSPDHSVLCGDVLVPVHLLVNSTSIARVKRDHVRYFHVELDTHDIVMAEGLAVESWLDTGNRAMFANAPVVDLVARFDDARAGRGCAPVCTDGPALTAIRTKLAARIIAQGRKVRTLP